MHSRVRNGASVLAAAAWMIVAGPPANPAIAQTLAEPATCADLSRRLDRQRALERGYQCRLTGPAWHDDAIPAEATKPATCGTEMRRALARRAARRAHDLETCLLQRLAASTARTPETSAWSGRRNTAPGAMAVQRNEAGMRSPGSDSDRGASTGPAPLTGETSLPDDAEARAQSARRVRELLAASPTPDTTGTKRGVSVAREFRSGLAWSYGGTIEGMHCTKWEEPSDPHDWYDNYLCAVRDLGFKWSYRGPVQGRGLKCIQVNEPSDPHFWHDNYFCWPRDLNVTFRFSAAGRLPGLDCIAIVEPSDPHTWRDNFLCYREAAP